MSCRPLGDYAQFGRSLAPIKTVKPRGPEAQRQKPTVEESEHRAALWERTWTPQPQRRQAPRRINRSGSSLAQKPFGALVRFSLIAGGRMTIDSTCLGADTAIDEARSAPHDAAMPRRARCYRGFIVSWEEPPVSANMWDINVSPVDRENIGKTEAITGATLEDAWANARRFIDDTASQK